MEHTKQATNRIRFLNTYIDNLTAAEAEHVVEQYLQDGEQHYVVSPNTDIIVQMQDDLELKQACDNADLILTDGQFLVKVSRLLKSPIKERVCMTDFVWNVCDVASKKGYRVCLFGGKEESLKNATVNMHKRYPNLNIVDAYSPPFGFEKNEEQLSYAVERIKASEADILIVFLGCPKQEKFIVRNYKKYEVPVSITMGGCVDFIAGNVKRAPRWMQEMGLEWLFRFAQEPARLFKRYFIDDVKIFLIIKKYWSV